MNAQTALDDLLALLKIAAGPGQESKVAEHLTAIWNTLGIPNNAWETDDTHLQSESDGGSGNLILRMEGHGQGERRLLSAHMDTVPYAIGAEPVVDGDRICNGADDCALGGDDRTGCAALLQAIRALVARKGDHAPVTFVFFVQEEIGLVGSRGLNAERLGNPFPTSGYNFDGEKPEVVSNAVIGTERFHIEIQGKAVHSSMPEEGLSAALVAAHALSEIARTGWFGRIKKEQGEGLANAGVLSGGQGTNVLVPTLLIQAEARSFDPEFRKKIIGQWKETFERAAREESEKTGHEAKVRFSSGPIYEPCRVPLDHPVVTQVAAAIETCSLIPTFEDDSGGNDSVWLNAKGIPTVCLGTGQNHPHQSSEFIDLPAFYHACRIAEALVTCSN